jgi:hypothetical protein
MARGPERTGTAVTPQRGRCLVLAAVAALLLGGCSSSPPPPPAPICPTALLLSGADRVAAYRSDGERTPEGLQHLAVLTDLASDCRYLEGALEVDLAFNLIAERGPAFAGAPLELAYFVATVDSQQQQIVAKQVFNSEIDFPADQQVAGSAQQLTLKIPAVTPEGGAGYDIYLGFQLDDAEMRERAQPLFH